MSAQRPPFDDFDRLLSETKADPQGRQALAEGREWVKTCVRTKMPPGCTGDCDQGRRDCTCGAALGMWDDERGSPWTSALLYALVLVAALLASHFYAWGFAS